MAQNQTTIESLFGRLISGVKNDDTKVILDTSNSILQSLPDDADAQKCKVVCYINSGKVALSSDKDNSLVR